MVDDDAHMHVRRQRLELFGQLPAEGGIVVDGDVRDDIDRKETVFLGIVEAMDLDEFLVGGEGAYHLVLQVGALVFSRGDGINADGHDDAVALEHQAGNPAGQAVDFMGGHRVQDADVQGSDHHVGAVVVEDDVVHAADALAAHDLLLDFMDKVRRDPGT